MHTPNALRPFRRELHPLERYGSKRTARQSDRRSHRFWVAGYVPRATIGMTQVAVLPPGSVAVYVMSVLRTVMGVPSAKLRVSDLMPVLSVTMKGNSNGTVSLMMIVVRFGHCVNVGGSMSAKRHVVCSHQFVLRLREVKKHFLFLRIPVGQKRNSHHHAICACALLKTKNAFELTSLWSSQVRLQRHCTHFSHVGSAGAGNCLVLHTLSRDGFRGTPLLTPCPSQKENLAPEKCTTGVPPRF